MPDSMGKRIVAEFRRRKLKASKRLFPAFERLGYHLTPVHFYEPIPDSRRLKESIWTERSELVGIEMNESRQLELLDLFATKYKGEYESFPRGRPALPHEYTLANPSFTEVDAEMLYCMIRQLRPRRIFEAGSGNSTYLAAKAVLKNKEEDGRECELVAFEPYPNWVLRQGFPGLNKVRPEMVEDVPLDEFGKMEKNDILFIDSSHVVRIGGDVKYLFLEVLPRLKKGVVVHVHDVFLPADYPREWVMKNHIFWTEQYLLQAFLAFNKEFEVMWGSGFMHLGHPERLAAAFSSYSKDGSRPGSFWMRRI